jgi:hypothetical protein
MRVVLQVDCPLFVFDFDLKWNEQMNFSKTP